MTHVTIKVEDENVSIEHIVGENIKVFAVSRRIADAGPVTHNTTYYTTDELMLLRNCIEEMLFLQDRQHK